MKREKIEELLINIMKKEMNQEQKQRFIKLISTGLTTREKRKKEMIIHGLYNLEFEL